MTPQTQPDSKETKFTKGMSKIIDKFPKDSMEKEIKDLNTLCPCTNTHCGILREAKEALSQAREEIERLSNPKWDCETWAKLDKVVSYILGTGNTNLAIDAVDVRKSLLCILKEDEGLKREISSLRSQLSDDKSKLLALSQLCERKEKEIVKAKEDVFKDIEELHKKHWDTPVIVYSPDFTDKQKKKWCISAIGDYWALKKKHQVKP